MSYTVEMTIMTLPLAALLLAFAPTPSSAQGRAVSCGCYCGVSLPPPCSDDACKSACGYGGGDPYAAYGGQPPMAGVKVGTWSKHFLNKHSERIENCGRNPLCMLMGTLVTGVTLPIGLVVDAPVLIVKGVGYGVYYGAVGVGRGAKAVGRGIAYPFRKKPKPVVTVYAPPPAAPAAPDCAGLAARQDALLAEERAEAEKFDLAIAQGQFDQGLALAKAAAGEVNPGVGAVETAETARDLAGLIRNFHADTRKCVAAGGATEAFKACLDAVNAAYDGLLAKFVDADKVEAAKNALHGYVKGVLDKSLPLVEDAARCQAK